MMTREEVLRTYSPLALAYLGDGVYELYVRQYVLAQGNCSNHTLHEKSGKFVSCGAQERFLKKLEPMLELHEAEIVRRGRNAKTNSKPHSATHGTYHAATGFEALWGYLYLAGETARLNELFRAICEEEPADEKNP